MAPPTESQILTQFLLTPAPLTTSTPLSVFTSYFPSASRSSSEIKRLYRALQQRHALLTDNVVQNIEREVRRGRALSREIRRAKQEERDRKIGDAGEDEEILVERALFGPTSNLPERQKHTLETIVPEMEKAVEDVEAEIEALEREAEGLLEDVRSTVSGLSDLRYGRLGNPGLKDEVLRSLEGLESVIAGEVLQ